MSLVVEQGPEAITIASGRYRLQFLWTGDRWTHRLETAHGSAVLATAFESPADSSPVSPTYQDLHVDSARDHATAMALGRFGRHHYSATFRVEAIPGFRLEVDVADRGPDDSPLVATYTVHRPSGEIFMGFEGESGWTLEDAILRIAPTSDEPSTRTVIGPAGPAACRCQIENLEPRGPVQNTRRLRYHWAIKPLSADLEPSPR